MLDFLYPVLSHSDHTVNILRVWSIEKVSRKSVKNATEMPIEDHKLDFQDTLRVIPITPAVLKAQISNHIASRREKCAMNAIIDYDRTDDLFKVRWHGYAPAEDTWVPPEHV